MMSRGRAFDAVIRALLELVVTAGAFFAAAGIRRVLPTGPDRPFLLGAHLWILPVALAVRIPLLWRWGFQRAQRTDQPGRELWKVAQITAVGMVAVVAVLVLWKFDPSRIFLGLFGAIDGTALCLLRLAAVSIAHHQRKRGYDRIYVVVAGTGKVARRHVEALRAHPEWGLEVRGLVSETPGLALQEVAGGRVLGSITDLPEILRGDVVDEVHFAVSRRTLERLDGPLRLCDEMGLTVRIVLGLLDRLDARPSLEFLGGTPVLVLASAPRDAVALGIKRALDVAVGAVGLVATSPVLLAAALAVRLTSRGPVIFRQKRSGMNGRVFTLYKFRTMVDGAESLQKSLRSRNEMSGPVFKMRNDPRVTRVGRVLRKLSIDELPQLWNVVRGDMSVVGPRPPLPAEVAQYERWQRRRLSMRPGLTCIWQVSGRNTVDFQRWMEMDLEYIDQWSLELDLRIVLKTIPAVLFRRGAR